MNGNKYLLSIVGVALLALAGFWYNYTNAESAKGEATRLRVAILEKQMEENDKFRDEMKFQLRKINEKIDTLISRR